MKEINIRFQKYISYKIKKSVLLTIWDLIRLERLIKTFYKIVLGVEYLEQWTIAGFCSLYNIMIYLEQIIIDLDKLSLISMICFRKLSRL